MRAFLKGLFLGVIFTAVLALFALYENNRQWEKEAYLHCAAVYTFSAFNNRVEWMWFDDYARTVLFPEAKEKVHGTPSPLPKFEKI